MIETSRAGSLATGCCVWVGARQIVRLRKFRMAPEAGPGAMIHLGLLMQALADCLAPAPMASRPIGSM